MKERRGVGMNVIQTKSLNRRKARSKKQIERKTKKEERSNRKTTIDKEIYYESHN